MYEYKAKIINVVDGDTFDLDVDLGFHIGHKIRVRLLGIDTPEIRGNKEKELGLICKKFAENFVGKDVVVKSEKDMDAKTDSFGRWLVHLEFIDNDRISILDIYNKLGINKLCDTYSEENVRSVLDAIGER